MFMDISNHVKTSVVNKAIITDQLSIVVRTEEVG